MIYPWVTSIVPIVAIVISMTSATAVGVVNNTHSNSFIRNHSFIFVSGWPQSGTSLLQQLFSVTPSISSMVEKCENALGKRCVQFNHEGQWLLHGSTRAYFGSGTMCANNQSFTTEQKNSIIEQV